MAPESLEPRAGEAGIAHELLRNIQSNFSDLRLRLARHRDRVSLARAVCREFWHGSVCSYLLVMHQKMKVVAHVLLWGGFLLELLFSILLSLPVREWLCARYKEKHEDLCRQFVV